MSALSGELPKSFHMAPTSPTTNRQNLSENIAICRQFVKALCRTRTDDPFLTMEVLYQLS